MVDKFNYVFGRKIPKDRRCSLFLHEYLDLKNEYENSSIFDEKNVPVIIKYAHDKFFKFCNEDKKLVNDEFFKYKLKEGFN